MHNLGARSGIKRNTDFLFFGKNDNKILFLEIVCFAFCAARFVRRQATRGAPGAGNQTDMQDVDNVCFANTDSA
jgi:hypothetical protein